VASLAENTNSDYRLVFICSPGDDEQIAACKQTEADVLVASWEPGHADFSKKINAAFAHTEEPWVFQGADDIRFSDGWDTEAIRVGNARNAGWVGTNDLGNPDVKRGNHSTHSLIRRAYIEEFGSGTFDNTGLVFSEAYDHQWADNDAVQTAMHRGRWAFAKRSIVEHTHPHWGKATMDATYEKATRATDADRRLYQQRMRLLKQKGALRSSPERLADLRSRLYR
jgi:hypothetical protein